MKTYLIIGGIIVVVGVAGIALTSKHTPNAPISSTEQQAQAEPSDTNASSLRTLLASTKPQTCQFQDETETATTDGTVYIANGKMRGDFNTISKAGQSTDGHMIMTDNTIHSWTSAYPMGITMSFDAQASGQASGQGVDPDKKVDYKCEDWTVDESKFVLPTNITFQDMSSFMVPPQAATPSY